MKRELSFGTACALLMGWVAHSALSLPDAEAPVSTPPPILRASVAASDARTLPGTAIGINWDMRTLRWVQNGTYGRMIRLNDGTILCNYESQGKSWVTRSHDEGRTWDAPRLVRELVGASAANPELLQLRSGRLWLFYNQRPRDKVQPFAIGACFSDDGGLTWQPRPTLIYAASKDFQDGCWEPAALQLPSGEIQLFFANEAPYTHSDEQEITLMRSFDNGTSWGKPEPVSFRANHRDGMPVPLLLRNGQDIVFAIEDNGFAPGAQLQPAIVKSSRATNWRQRVVGGDSPQRWNAFVSSLPPNVYAGAPYLRQLSSGETLLSCQSTEGGRAKPQMVVYIGDAQAHAFAHRSVPIELPSEIGGSWNSLFVKNAETVTALTATNIKGRGGLWAIDGYVVRKKADDG